jgi:hypothetical protein
LQIPERFVLELQAGFPKVFGELLDSVFGHTGHADGGSDRAALDQAADDSTAFFARKPVHTDHYA